jgi:hypothetical protein
LKDRLCCLMIRVPGYRSRDPRFDSPRLQVFREVVSLERCPHSLVSAIEELAGRKSSGYGLENQKYGRMGPLRWPRDILYPQKLTLTSPTNDISSVGIFRPRNFFSDLKGVGWNKNYRFFSWIDNEVYKCFVCIHTSHLLLVPLWCFRSITVACWSILHDRLWSSLDRFYTVGLLLVYNK